MDINEQERNPIYPYALRFCDIDIGVKFIEIFAASSPEDILTRKGVFLDRPRMYDLGLQKLPATKDFIADAKFNSTDRAERIFLTTYGIIFYHETQAWSEFRFTILDSDESIKQFNEWYNGIGKGILKHRADLLKEMNDESDEYERALSFGQIEE